MSLAKNHLDMGKERLLVTGASSNFAKYLLEKLDRSKYYSIGISRSLDRLNGIALDEKMEGDISDKDFVNRCVQQSDVILHTAAITHALKKQDYYAINYDSTAHLVDAAKKNQVKRFIFISSRTAVEGSGAYGESKLAAEKYIQQNFDDWLIFQPSEIFGLNKKEGIEKLIDDTLYKSSVFCPSGVSSKMYPIHIDDCIDLTCQFMEDPSCRNKVITLNGSEGYSYEELVQAISAAVQKQTRIVPIPKFVLRSAASCIRLFGVSSAPIVPDQVPRLYSTKPISRFEYPYKSVVDYAKNLYVMKGKSVPV